MSNKEQQSIGNFIKILRQKKGFTQKEFAKLLKTSQSAVARMEGGGQNFTLAELQKVSNVLNHQLVTISDSVDFEVEGGHKLSGSITTNTSKNGALHVLMASLINKGTTTIHDVPRIEEIFRVIEVFDSIGVSVKWTSERTLAVKPPKEFNLKGLEHESTGRVRSMLMSIGALIYTHEEFRMPHAGGCKMGERTIAAHRYGLMEFGVKVETRKDAYHVSSKKLKAADFVMYEAGDTAATNLLIAASGIAGESTIRFAPSNYMVQDVCFFLQSLGVQIEGVGTSTLRVTGLKEIKKDIDVYVGEDPIESMLFITAAAITGSQLEIKRCPIDFLALELLKLKTMGLKFKKTEVYIAKNGGMRLVDLTIMPSKLKAAEDKIHALPYPGINIDNLPFFVPIAALAKGTTLIHDWTWENRAIYFAELNRLGANVQVADPHRVFIEGVSELKAAQVVCPPALRPAAIILIAMLAAPGKSVLRNVYTIERGYQDLAKRLSSIGAKVKVIKRM